MSTGPEYDPAKTTHAQLVERKAAPGNVIQLYHGTDAESAQKIKTEHPKLIGAPFHDFAIGRNSAFYLTTSHETAVAFAKERANALGGETKAAVVTVAVHRDKVKIYEFDAVDGWQKFVDYNRAKPRPKDKPQHELVRTHDIVAGWISTQTKTHGRVPVAYADHAGVYHFDWQYVVVNQTGLNALENIVVELL